MIDDFFQKKPLSHPPSILLKNGWLIVLRTLFYTFLIGFISGSTFGYLHMKGWIATAEKGLILYGTAFGIGAIFSLCLVIYQLRQKQGKPVKVKRSRH